MIKFPFSKVRWHLPQQNLKQGIFHSMISSFFVPGTHTATLQTVKSSLGTYAILRLILCTQVVLFTL